MYSHCIKEQIKLQVRFSITQGSCFYLQVCVDAKKETIGMYFKICVIVSDSLDGYDMKRRKRKDGDDMIEKVV